MSKISCDFKLKDLYAIKHALEETILNKTETLDTYSPYIQMFFKKDIEHEKKIVDYVVDVISKYKSTEKHYSE